MEMFTNGFVIGYVMVCVIICTVFISVMFLSTFVYMAISGIEIIKRFFKREGL